MMIRLLFNTPVLVFCFLCIAFIPQSYAQNTASVEGSVTNSRGELLPGVNIIIDGTTTGTATNARGAFILEGLQPGEYVFIASYVGYQKEQLAVVLSAGDRKEIQFTLSRSFDMPQITVIGRQPQRLERVPGSAAVITEAQIANIAPVSSHEVFRRIAGVHAVEEEGLGLRANIGIRGLDPSKSRSVLMLEDGIPVALAPYGEPEMYYTPSMDRMAGVEVIKGSGSILFGPQTFGGVVNYVTADPTSEPVSTINVHGGEGGFFTGRFGYGTTVGNTGVQLTYLRRQGNEVGLLDFGVNDLSSKLKFVLSDRSVVGVKLGFYDETSNSTYVGLTQNMYDSGLFDFTHLSPDDILNVRRYSASVSHDFFINENVTLRTTAYGYTTTRNWSRQDFDNIPVDGRDYIRTVGNAGQPGGAIFFRDLTGNRNRQFEVFGFEPRLSVNYTLGSVTNELDTGFRFLYERAFEQRINGNVLSPQSGVLRDDEIRTGYALSGYVQNRFNLTDALSVTPGVRLEYFDYERDIRRLGNEQLNVVNSDEVVKLIPGIGFNYLLTDGVAFYGGAHRGFGPPRVKDAITADGVSEELDAELSWNFEIGSRATIIPGLFVELTAFYMDFSNQIIPVAEAAGGAGTPGASLTNGGATEHLGLETTIDVDIQQLTRSSWGLGISTSATFVQAEFSEDRFVQSGGNVINVKGNRVPYAPEFLLSTNAYVVAPFGLGLSLTGTYTGEQFGDVLNQREGSLNGRNGLIDSYFVLDGRLTYTLPQFSNATFNVSVKNLFDERYIVSRRPQGIRVGLPRFVTAGVDWSF
ncbi:MAG: TonB-dependent receptor [Balneolales bacterium]|nr:TonB-dependent receptor [Balneolales bacterium]